MLDNFIYKFCQTVDNITDYIDNWCYERNKNNRKNIKKKRKKRKRKTSV